VSHTQTAPTLRKSHSVYTFVSGHRFGHRQYLLQSYLLPPETSIASADMASQRPRVQDFHIGWICAVEVEYVIASELLDEEFPEAPRTSSNDDNMYTCGRIGRHQVVMACLPKGKYGLTSAASVAKDMLRSFPTLRVGLMVGIGGGAPSRQYDIRLGDVVVGTPSGRTGGVVHYESGKTLQGGDFERTGSLDAPPMLLLSAVQKLSTLHKRKGHQIAQVIDATLTQNKRLRKVYAKPEIISDVLFESSFLHADSSSSCSEICFEHNHRAVGRPTRLEDMDDPVIHYGLIASADRLMKDAQFRDDLAAKEGVLCFEMEAAGLMGRFPCIVIRGVCDYSDTHKNDAWQGYASATAAAYAKSLIYMIPSDEVAESTPIVECHDTCTDLKVCKTIYLGQSCEIFSDTNITPGNE
jgi:nucleoside phosphorylase